MSFDSKPVRPGKIYNIRNATVDPFAEGKRRGGKRPAGIFNQYGKYVRLGRCYRNSRMPVTLRPGGGVPQGDIRALSGRWLFGGMLYQHFGHFLVESTSRLWAMDHIDGPIDGVLYFPRKRLTWEKRYHAPVMPWLAQYGTEFSRVEAPTSPVRVDELVVASQGFGTGDMMAGSSEYRDFVRARLGRHIAAEGAEKIYLSRTQLNSKRGRYLGERRIEDLMEAEGYRIYHPQSHSFEEQIAQYKAARVIVSSDNSALHLAAFFMRPEDRIAIIKRRGGEMIEDFKLQLGGFAGIVPDVIDVLDGRVFLPEGQGGGQASEAYTVLDLERLGQALRGKGYIHRNQSWTAFDEGALSEELAVYAEALTTEIVLQAA